MKLDLTMHALDLKRFTFNKETRTLSAFESDLRDKPFDGHYRWLRRLYDDAMDIGMAIRSHLTGKLETFYLEREETNEGDILAWYFKPVHKLANVDSVVIFND
jgi:hypothetical protein